MSAYVVRVVDEFEEVPPSFWGIYTKRAEANAVAEEIKLKSNERFSAYVEMVQSAQPPKGNTDAEWILAASS